MDIDPRWWDTASFDGRPVSEVLAERDVYGFCTCASSPGPAWPV
jgi:hypothetical protein